MAIFGGLRHLAYHIAYHIFSHTHDWKLIMLHAGNEGSGLRTNIKRTCSGFIKVEMGLPRQQLAADSLNVSVAAGILIHSILGAATRVVSKDPAAPMGTGLV